MWEFLNKPCGLTGSMWSLPRKSHVACRVRGGFRSLVQSGFPVSQNPGVAVSGIYYMDYNRNPFTDSPYSKGHVASSLDLQLAQEQPLRRLHKPARTKESWKGRAS